MRIAPSALSLLSLAAALAAQAPKFHAPAPVKADGTHIQVESPGYAFPAMHDIDGDGRADLVVGQFRGGKMRVYKNQGKDGFAAGTWLEADGDIAEVPGVW